MIVLPRATAWIGLDPNPSTTLFYALQADPAPLTASLSTKEPSFESLTIVVTNNSGAGVKVEEIDIAFTVGTDATDLTFTTSGIRTSISDTVNWSVSGAPVVPITSGGFAVTVTPATGPYAPLAAGASLVVQIANIQASTTVGTAAVKIAETLEASSGATLFELTTFPYGFYFSSLTANAANGSGLAIVSQVNNGTSVTLTWDSSVLEPTAFTILYSDAAGKQQTATPELAGEWTTPHGLTSDTMFVVVVDTKSPTGEPIQAAQTVAVSVYQPALNAASLVTSGAIQAGGNIQAAGVISGIGICPVGTVIMFQGDISMPGENFDATGLGLTGTQYQGWQICNGKNGSHDLRDKFIAGAGNQYPVGGSGGQDSVTLSLDQIPVHDHNGYTDAATAQLNYPGVFYCSEGTTAGIMVNINQEDPNGYRPNALTTKGYPDIQVIGHSHPIEAEGGSGAHENRPQFFALAYLVRVAT